MQTKLIYLNSASGGNRHCCAIDGDIDAGTGTGTGTGQNSRLLSKPKAVEPYQCNVYRR